MPIILSPEADRVPVSVTYQPPEGEALTFRVTLRGGLFVKHCRAPAAREEAPPSDPWLQTATPDARVLDACICEWDGVTGEDGRPLPFDPALLRQLLEVPGMTAALTRAASDAMTECEAKNLRGWQGRPPATTAKSPSQTQETP